MFPMRTRSDFEQYLDMTYSAGSSLQDKWLSKLSAAPDVSINVSPDLSLCTLDVIMRCAFSYDKDVQLTEYAGGSGGRSGNGERESVGELRT